MSSKGDSLENSFAALRKVDVDENIFECNGLLPSVKRSVPPEERAEVLVPKKGSFKKLSSALKIIDVHEKLALSFASLMQIRQVSISMGFFTSVTIISELNEHYAACIRK